MDFKLIDYSDMYFSRIAKQTLPKQRSGKFVQLVDHDADSEYVVMSPKELSIYHANIIERFSLSHKEMKGSYTHKGDYFEIHDGPFEVIGGGMWSIDDENRTMSLFGTSTMYGKYDPTGMKKKMMSQDIVKGYELKVDGF